jgi:outer membrane protein OmpA-like peptidoglycan-associated protein
VPSERVRAQFLREARLALPGAEVRDDMVVAARGAPENWTKVAMLGLEQLVTLKQGRVHLDKRAGLSVSGKTDNRVVFHAVQAALSKPMFGFAVSSDGIRFENRQEGKLDVERELAHAREVSAGICQQLLTSVAAKGMIRFRKASAKLAVGSFETLDKVVLAAKKCPKVAIRIAGHTDSDGPADYNQRLSEARAGSVASYLSRAGISQSRLAAVGYGEAKPIAPNDTFDNKARNRRIEFVVTTR